MVEHNQVNVKLSDSQLDKSRNVVKNQTGVTLRINIKMFNENNLTHELLLRTVQTPKLRKAFENNIPTESCLKLKYSICLIQSGGFLGLLLRRIADPFMKVAVPLTKDILAPLGITAAASAIDAGIQK